VGGAPPRCLRYGVITAKEIPAIAGIFLWSDFLLIFWVTAHPDHSKVMPAGSLMEACHPIRHESQLRQKDLV
jgi:hypothetical protein